jgi:hypothetical protein
METPQPPHVSVSGHIVIQGQLSPASSAGGPDSVPAQPRPPRWKFWQCWKDFHKVTAYATLLLATFTFVLALGTIALAYLSQRQIEEFRKQGRQL